MAKQRNEMTSDDLMQLPDDIAGLVLDVQGRQAQSASPIKSGNKETAQNTEPPAKTESEFTSLSTVLPKSNNVMWNTFLKHGEGYAYRVRKPDRKMYWIDDDIVEALKECDVNRMSATDKINAILRTFIVLNKEELKECVRPKDRLL